MNKLFASFTGALLIGASGIAMAQVEGPGEEVDEVEEMNFGASGSKMVNDRDGVERSLESIVREPAKQKGDNGGQLGRESPVEAVEEAEESARQL